MSIPLLTKIVQDLCKSSECLRDGLPLDAVVPHGSPLYVRAPCLSCVSTPHFFDLTTPPRTGPSAIHESYLA